MKRMISLLLFSALLLPSCLVAAHATTGMETSVAPIVTELSQLIAFARQNLDRDPRMASLSPAERLEALLESLMLYGVRFPSSDGLSLSMSHQAMARKLLASVPLRNLPMLRASISELASTLSPVMGDEPSSMQRAETTDPQLFSGHGD